MSVERLFTREGAWFGGFYELALEIGPRSDVLLLEVLSALWSHPALDGCFLDCGREPVEQRRSLPERLEEGLHLYGVAQMPNDSRVACGTCLIREGGDGPDWLDLYLPLGSLGTAYPVGGFPFESEPTYAARWRYEVEDWLAEIGVWVAKTRSFKLGLIGFEVSGEMYASDIAALGVPDERVVGYLLPSDGTIQYHRRTRA
jgi:hypothetical protein